MSSPEAPLIDPKRLRPLSSWCNQASQELFRYVIAARWDGSAFRRARNEEVIPFDPRYLDRLLVEFRRMARQLALLSGESDLSIRAPKSKGPERSAWTARRSFRVIEGGRGKAAGSRLPDDFG